MPESSAGAIPRVVLLIPHLGKALLIDTVQ
jgi:hypothetical protein